MNSLNFHCWYDQLLYSNIWNIHIISILLNLEFLRKIVYPITQNQLHPFRSYTYIGMHWLH